MNLFQKIKNLFNKQPVKDSKNSNEQQETDKIIEKKSPNTKKKSERQTSSKKNNKKLNKYIFSISQTKLLYLILNGILENKHITDCQSAGGRYIVPYNIVFWPSLIKIFLNVIKCKSYIISACKDVDLNIDEYVSSPEEKKHFKAYYDEFCELLCKDGLALYDIQIEMNNDDFEHFVYGVRNHAEGSLELGVLYALINTSMFETEKSKKYYLSNSFKFKPMFNEYEACKRVLDKIQGAKTIVEDINSGKYDDNDENEFYGEEDNTFDFLGNTSYQGNDNVKLQPKLSEEFFEKIEDFMNNEEDKKENTTEKMKPIKPPVKPTKKKTTTKKTTVKKTVKKKPPRQPKKKDESNKDD